jgi:hypothetical protein
MTTIRIEGLDQLIRRIDSLAKLNKTKAAIRAAAVMLQGKIKQYPPVSRRPNPLIKTNDRVRRGFFYHLKHGNIEVPYRRGASPGSQKLGQSWTTRTENSGFRAIIGTGVSYARLVQDSANQTAYHKGTGWITTRDVTQRYGDDAIRQIKQALISEVESG